MVKEKKSYLVDERETWFGLIQYSVTHREEPSRHYCHSTTSPLSLPIYIKYSSSSPPLLLLEVIAEIKLEGRGKRVIPLQT